MHTLHSFYVILKLLSLVVFFQILMNAWEILASITEAVSTRMAPTIADVPEDGRDRIVWMVISIIRVYSHTSVRQSIRRPVCLWHSQLHGKSWTCFAYHSKFNYIVSYFCPSDFNECLQLSCANGGTCINIQGSYQCRCPEGWTGQNCEIGKV